MNYLEMEKSLNENFKLKEENEKLKEENEKLKEEKEKLKEEKEKLKEENEKLKNALYVPKIVNNVFDYFILVNKNVSNTIEYFEGKKNI